MTDREINFKMVTIYSEMLTKFKKNIKVKVRE